MNDGTVSFSDPTSAASRNTHVCGRIWLRVRRWVSRRRQRDALAELNDGLLRDIGVSRERDIGMSKDAAEREALKLFWSP